MAANNEKKKINVMSLNKRLLIVEKVCIALTEANKELEDRIEELVAQLNKPAAEPTLNKVEQFNGQRTPEPKDNMEMDDEHKMQSMVNAITVLPPNFVKDGRHSKENIEAIAGFKIAPEQYEELYANWKHTALGVAPVS